MPLLHVVLVPYNNPHKTEMRWRRDVLAALKHAGAPYAVTAVDNSRERNENLADLFGDGYLWQEGRNLQYGPSINLAVQRVVAPYVLYVCSQHGRSVDPSWLADLLEPLQADPSVGMTGHLMGSNSPEGVAHATGCSWVAEKYRFDDGVKQHVQGGVFACRTEVLLRFPYPPEIAQLYTDHVMTWAALKAGYKCVDVPSIISVWRRALWEHEKTGKKYYHDESEGP